MAVLHRVEKMRNHSMDMCARGQCMISHRAHEPHAAATVNNLNAGLAQDSAKARCCIIIAIRQAVA